MKAVKLEHKPNKDAIELLTETIKSIEAGEIQSVAVCWVTPDGSIGGDISNGKNQLAMWASMLHLERTFCRDFIDTPDNSE